MAGIKLVLALSFVILLLLSRSPESSAYKTVGPRKQRPSSEDVWSAFRTRKMGVHVKKGGGGHAGGGGGGHAGGRGRAGGGRGRMGRRGYGGHVWPGGGAKPNSGTHRSSAIGSSPPPPRLASAACSSLLLGLLFASTLL